MNSAYSVRDTTTAEGVHQPTTSLRSGGPGSVIPWDTLGYQGRNFVGKGPTVSDIEKFTGQPAMEPIRAYAGLASAPDAQSRAALAVRDLRRAGGFQRKNLLVVTTTGASSLAEADQPAGRRRGLQRPADRADRQGTRPLARCRPDRGARVLDRRTGHTRTARRENLPGHQRHHHTASPATESAAEP
jgi:Alpha/beta-hydrolase family N-terminus/Alpha/beta-hydrolase family